MNKYMLHLYANNHEGILKQPKWKHKIGTYSVKCVRGKAPFPEAADSCLVAEGEVLLSTVHGASDTSALAEQTGEISSGNKLAPRSLMPD